MEIPQTAADPAQKRRRFLDRSITTRELIFLLALVFCLSPVITPPIALFLGIIVAQFVGHPYLHLNHKATHILLQVSVIGLGFGMNIGIAAKAGRDGFLFTVVSILLTMLLGWLLGRLLKIDKKVSYLICSGTAICGGSAIAAISPIIKAEEKQISVALSTVFILNSLALFVFPVIGHALGLSQNQFGLWCAIAIHDTSSVVGAANKYGTAAAEIATTVKLARALWIIPLSFISTFLFRNELKKIKIPYFIGFFLVAMALNSFVPMVHAASPFIVAIAKAGLTVTLFLIGCGLSRSVLQSVGIRPFLQGSMIWVLISAAALLSVVFLA